MILSKTTTYGIRALAYLATRRGCVCSLQEIAHQAAVPPIYLGKILNELRRSRIVASVRGIHGGYKLERPPEEISLLDVFFILDPNPYMDTCVLGLGLCHPENACSLHGDWQGIKQQVLDFLKSRTISQIAIPRVDSSAERPAAASQHEDIEALCISENSQRIVHTLKESK
jgi:Rrf2 family protein